MKMLALINNLFYDGCAILKGFSESGIADKGNAHEARIKNGSVFSKAKVVSLKFRLVEPANRAALYRAFSIAALRALSSRHHTGADKCGRFTDKPSGKNCWCTRIHKQANKVTLAFSSRYERLIIRICTSIIQDGLRMVGNLSLACPIH